MGAAAATAAAAAAAAMVALGGSSGGTDRMCQRSVRRSGSHLRARIGRRHVFGSFLRASLPVKMREVLGGNARTRTISTQYARHYWTSDDLLGSCLNTAAACPCHRCCRFRNVRHEHATYGCIVPYPLHFVLNSTGASMSALAPRQALRPWPTCPSQSWWPARRKHTSRRRR